MAGALAPTPQPVVCPLAVFFPHVLGGNGCSMAISVLWGMQALSHLFVVFHPTPSQSFPPTAEQQTTLYKVTITETAESMNKLNRCLDISFFNGGFWTVVQFVMSSFFFTLNTIFRRTQKCCDISVLSTVYYTCLGSVTVTITEPRWYPVSIQPTRICTPVIS